MKLQTTLKDRPSFLHLVPLCDLFALAGMLLLLGPMFLNESGISVKLPSSSFQMQRYTQPIVVTIGPGDQSAFLYLDKEPLKLEQLSQRLRELKKQNRSQEAIVLLKTDVRTSVGMERQISEKILAEGFSLALAGEIPPKKKRLETEPRIKP